MNEWMDWIMDGRMNQRMDEWIDNGRMNQWMEG